MPTVRAVSAVMERSTAYLTVTLLDKAGAQQIPSSLAYRIDCMTTGQPVRASTPLAAAAQVEIVLTPDDNAMRLAGNASERRRVTVMATYGAADAVNDQYDYDVTNLFGVG